MTCRERCQDPTCPCPDGDACHYEDLPGSPAMRPLWENSVDLVQLSRGYGFEVIDYGADREGRGLLISVGSGMLMAVMDQLPSCRWAVDLSGGASISKTIDWCAWLPRLVSHVVVVAWFTITKPAFLQYGLEAVGSGMLACYSNEDLGVGIKCSTLDGLVRYVEERWGSTLRRSETGDGAIEYEATPQAPNARQRPAVAGE